ncbi:hypothetical protein RhiirA5_410825 [Rhizophagus irregularis]|uniref:Uncharacterized protein n=1 Tax=Rhizophagus irregularis TaxID=588596 RepID=A0A2I1E3I1_9GLOM|nr:hypothetical protein RhiirA5_410825 [Rhizophagus irregularis]PKY16702.1 hypothetical protein RhiirB3_429163 [Rhizophagus irregularis]
MFYELLCITRAGLMEANFKDLVRNSAKHVLERGGVVRGFENWGEMPLAKRIRRHQVYHTRGQYVKEFFWF